MLNRQILHTAYLLHILFFAAQNDCFAQQTEKYNIRYIKSSEGLTSGNIRKIIQDKLGYTWIATQDGLFRYDSRNFSYYNKSQEFPYTISGSDVRDIALDTINNLIWAISALGGIDEIDIFTGKVITTLPQNSNQFLQAKLLTCIYPLSKYILVGTDSGLFTYSKIDKKWEAVDYNIFTDKIYTLQNNILIFSRDNKIYKFDTHTRKLVPTKSNYLSHFKSFESLQVFNCTDAGTSEAWMATSAGLRKLIITNDSIIIQTDQFPNIKTLHSRPVYDLTKDKKGKLWVCTENNVLKIDPLRKDYKLISNSRVSDESNWFESAYHIYADKDGNIWIGCQQGVAYLPPTSSPFVSFSKSTESPTRINHAYFLLPVNDSIIFSCAENGVFEINTSSGTIQALDLGKSYHHIFSDPFRNYIFSSDDGAFIYKNGNFVPLAEIYPEFKQLGKIILNTAIYVQDSLLLLSTENEKGIIIWNYTNRRARFASGIDEKPLLKEKIINSIFRLDSRSILILSDKNIYQWDLTKNSIITIPLKNENGKDYRIFFDAARIRNNIYLATYGYGILILDSLLNLTGNITSQNGLSNNGIYKILPWKDSLLFFTTNYGLSKYNIGTKNIKNYFQSYGLHGDAFEETSGTIYKNILLSGGPNGFSIVYPDKLSNNTSPPLLYISKIELKRKISNLSETGINIKSVSITPNTIQTTVFFSTINYLQPEKTLLYYRIIEQSGNWILSNNPSALTLIGLSPGTYHLQVQAFNEDGVGSEIKELTLIFLPKWYQTWWFKSLIVLVLMAIAYELYRMRINQLRKEEKIRNQLASDLHDDLGSTLNSIKVHSNLAQMEKENPNHLVMVKQGAQDAINGVRDIIWVLDDKKDQLGDTFSRVGQFAEPLCLASRVQYKAVLEDETQSYKLGKEEKRNLYMIIKESINNSLKYAESSQITIHASRPDKKLRIEISDNGKGFDLTATGNGYGLRNIRNRAKTVGYAAEIISTPGAGTRILLQKI